MNCLDTLNKIEYKDIYKIITTSNYSYIPEEPEVIVAGLYNADLNYKLINIIKVDTDLFIKGMKITKQVTAAKKMQIYLPEVDLSLSDELVESLKNEDIVIKYGSVNKLENKNNILCHFEDIVKIAKLANGEDINFTYVTVNGNEIEKVSYGTKIKELFNNNLNSKFYEVGNKFYDKSVLEKNIEELSLFNGVVNSFDEKSCIISEANKSTLEYREKSCGKCLFCREGLIQLNTMMDDIAVGKGKVAYISLMNEIGEAMKISNNCSLGEVAAEAVVSSLEINESEYLTHIKNKKCNSGVCISNDKIYIDPKLCTGCGDCISHCQYNCIDGKDGYIHLLYDLDCSKCGKCIDKCSVGAIKKTVGKVPRLPDRLIKAKMFKE